MRHAKKNSNLVVKIPGIDAIRDFQSGKIIDKKAFKKRRCPVCTDSKTLERGKVDIFPILKCLECGLSFCGLLPTGKSNLGRFDDRSRKYDVSSTTPKNKELNSHKRFLHRELKNYIDLKKPLNFLDFGSGSGQMIGAAMSLGWKACSVEINPDLRKIVSDNYGVPTYANMKSIPESDKFDVIWMNYVACLLPEPVKIFEEVRKYLSKEGVFVLSDPNFDGYCVKKNDLLHYYFAPPTLNYWTHASIRNALKLAGFKYISDIKVSKFHPAVFLDGMHPSLEYFDKHSNSQFKRTKLQNLLRRIFTSIFFIRIFKVLILILSVLGASKIRNMGFGNQITIACRK